MWSGSVSKMTGCTGNFSPENTASRRTIEKLGGELLETVEVPEDHWLYERGELVKNIYLFKKKDWER